MPTKIINSNTIFYNKFTRFGRKRNEVINQLLEKDYPIIRQRRDGRNSYVFLGYKNAYSSLANIAARINRNGSSEIKTSKYTRSPIPSSKRTYEVTRSITDKKGNTETSYKKWSIYNRIVEKLVSIKKTKNGITDIKTKSQKTFEDNLIAKSTYHSKLNGLEIDSYQFSSEAEPKFKQMLEYPEEFVSSGKLEFINGDLNDLYESKFYDFYTVIAHDKEDNSFFEIFKNVQR